MFMFFLIVSALLTGVLTLVYCCWLARRSDRLGDGTTSNAALGHLIVAIGVIAAGGYFFIDNEAASEWPARATLSQLFRVYPGYATAAFFSVWALVTAAVLSGINFVKTSHTRFGLRARTRFGPIVSRTE
jgi:hypothetical protein